MSDCDCAWKNGTHHEMCAFHIQKIKTENTALKAKLAKAKEALEFYADGVHCPACMDGSALECVAPTDKALAALEKIQEPK